MVGEQQVAPAVWPVPTGVGDLLQRVQKEVIERAERGGARCGAI